MKVANFNYAELFESQFHGELLKFLKDSHIDYTEDKLRAPDGSLIDTPDEIYIYSDALQPNHVLKIHKGASLTQTKTEAGLKLTSYINILEIELSWSERSPGEWGLSGCAFDGSMAWERVYEVSELSEAFSKLLKEGA